MSESVKINVGNMNSDHQQDVDANAINNTNSKATATQNVVANFDISAEGSKDGLNITELDKKTMTNMCSMDYKTIFYNYPARADIEFETQRYQVSDFVQNFDAFRQLNVEDLTGDRGVLKLREKSVDDATAANTTGPTLNESTDGLIIMHYALYTEHHLDSFESTIARRKPEIYRNGGMFRGMNIGIDTMRFGERCLLLIEPEYIWDHHSSCPLHSPPKQPILVDIYYIQLISWQELLGSLEFIDNNIDEFSFDEMYTMGTEANQTIEDCIKAGNIRVARNLSSDWIGILKRLRSMSEDETKKRNILLCKLCLNLAKCQLLCEEYIECIKNCIDMLEFPNLDKEFKTKAWYRMGCAYNGLNEVEMSDRAFKRAHFLSPTDSIIKDEMEKIDKILRCQRMSEVTLETDDTHQEGRKSQSLATVEFCHITDRLLNDMISQSQRMSKLILENDDTQKGGEPPSLVTVEFCHMIDRLLDDFIRSIDTELIVPQRFEPEENAYMESRIKMLDLNLRLDDATQVICKKKK